jgi:hypothetical protein
VDRVAHERVDVVKGRLICNCGYCEACAMDILAFVATIYAREQEGQERQREQDRADMRAFLVYETDMQAFLAYEASMRKYGRTTLSYQDWAKAGKPGPING